MFQRILVPLDGSDLAETVLPYVRTLAKQFAAEIALVRVPVYLIIDYRMTDPTLISTLYDDIHSEATDYLQRTAAQLKQDGFVVTSELREGPVAETIVAYANEIHADLIALSTHGRSGLGRWLIGSVADRVVHLAKVPVLLLRPTAPESTPQDRAEREAAVA